MKTFLVIISMIGLLSFTTTGQKKDVTKLLDNQQTRTEIFNAIQNNHELMNEFMNHMKGNQHAMMMWQGNTQFMNQKYMRNLMRNHPQAMRQMMNSMIGASATDSTWTNQMIKYMNQYPQMWQMMRYHMNGMMSNNGRNMMGHHGYGMMGGNGHQMMNYNNNDQ